MARLDFDVFISSNDERFSWILEQSFFFFVAEFFINSGRAASSLFDGVELYVHFSQF